jgi:hypothetical protein
LDFSEAKSVEIGDDEAEDDDDGVDDDDGGSELEDELDSILD